MMGGRHSAKGVTSGELVWPSKEQIKNVKEAWAEYDSDVEVIENLEALAALTGDHEGILRAAIDRISALKQQLAHFSDLASKHRDELEQRVAELRAKLAEKE